MKVALILLALAAAAVATEYRKADYGTPYNGKKNYDYPSGYASQYNKEYYAPANYHYKYDVKDDYSYVDFGAKENRYGDKTEGYYYVVLPDGRKQIVNYYVDGYSGYVAEVKYEGEAKYADNYNKPYTPYRSDYASPSYTSGYAPAAKSYNIKDY